MTNINLTGQIIKGAYMDPYSADVYHQCGFKGTHASLSAKRDLMWLGVKYDLEGYTTQDLNNFGLQDGRISSIVVGPYTRIELYMADNFYGSVYVIHNPSSDPLFFDCIAPNMDLFVRSIIIGATTRGSQYVSVYKNKEEMLHENMSHGLFFGAFGIEQFKDDKKNCSEYCADYRNGIIILILVLVFLLWYYKDK